MAPSPPCAPQELRPLESPRSSDPLSVGDLLLAIHFRTDDVELRIFSTIMTLGTPRDVTLQELWIETCFPADEASEHAWRKIAAV